MKFWCNGLLKKGQKSRLNKKKIIVSVSNINIFIRLELHEGK